MLAQADLSNTLALSVVSLDAFKRAVVNLGDIRKSKRNYHPKNMNERTPPLKADQIKDIFRMLELDGLGTLAIGSGSTPNLFTKIGLSELGVTDATNRLLPHGLSPQDFYDADEVEAQVQEEQKETEQAANAMEMTRQMQVLTTLASEVSGQGGDPQAVAGASSLTSNKRLSSPTSSGSGGASGSAGSSPDNYTPSKPPKSKAVRVMGFEL